jgi:uncharacterized membrane protein (DUF106 family)
MNETESQRVVRLLEEIREDQKLQVARQLEALELQRKQFAVFEEQAVRTERLQHRAEQLQERSAGMVGGARKLLITLVPIVIALIAYVSWLIYRERG